MNLLTTTRSRFESRIQCWMWVKFGLLLVAAGGVLYILTQTYPVGVDWHYTFGRLWTHWDDPYEVRGLVNPPWVMFFMPHSALPTELGNAINLLLNIAVPGAIVIKVWGKYGPTTVIPLLLMLYTFPPFLDLVRTNNVEWIPLLALLMPDGWLIATLAVKPQSIGGAALIRWKQHHFSWRLLMPVTALFVLSLVLWGAWFLRIDWATASTPWAAANFSPFPYLVPLGLYMLCRAYCTEDEVLGEVATPLLVPYFAGYGVFPILVLLTTSIAARRSICMWHGCISLLRASGADCCKSKTSPRENGSIK